MKRLRTAIIVALTAVLTSTPALASLWEDVYRGLEILTVPAGNTGGNRFGRLAIRQNEFGEGYRLELDRRFGVDTFGRPEVYEFGNYELQLSGSLQSTLSYTSKGLLTGNAEFLTNALSYELRGKTGAQDVTLSGVLDVAGEMEINQLGFYTLDFDLSNNPSGLLLDGLAVDFPEALPTDFEIGPISVKGNIYFDLAMSFLTALGIDTSGLEGAFPGSPISRINDEIGTLLQEQSVVLGETAEGWEAGKLADAAVVELSGAPGQVLDSGASSNESGRGTFPGPVPEPVSLLALAIGSLVMLAARRRA